MIEPLRKTYSKTRPYAVDRYDEDDGSITYEIWDHRPDSYRRVCRVSEDPVDDAEYSPDRGQAKRDAELIARALNALLESSEQ
ncbi:MAG: hypothetical protein GEV06_16575 [Luteitalea sp.]|nr:hypothetical protein [Luteitalea sp.]